MNFRGGHKRKVTVVGGYCFAKKRNIGQVSSDTLAATVAGDPEHCGLKDGVVVMKYEHRYCVAQRLVSEEFYNEKFKTIGPGIQEFPLLQILIVQRFRLRHIASRATRPIKRRSIRKQFMWHCVLLQFVICEAITTTFHSHGRCVTYNSLV